MKLAANPFVRLAAAAAAVLVGAVVIYLMSALGVYAIALVVKIIDAIF